MTVTKTQLAEAYAAALNKALGKQWDYEFSRRDAGKFLDVLWPVVSELALKDTKKTAPGSVPLGNLGRLKMRYKPATKARKGSNPEPRRDCRRPFRLSHAAMADCSSMA
jgi:hypothetical protein